MKTSQHWALLLMFAVQLAVPAWIVGEHRYVLATGEVVRFRAHVRDTQDVLRGRYLEVDVLPRRLTPESPQSFSERQRAYASIDLDEDGYAVFSAVSIDAPEEGLYIEVVVSPVGSSEVYVDLPQKRYFLTEGEAPAAEAVYRRRALSDRDAYLAVAIHDGRSAIKGLYVGGERIEGYLQRLAAGEPA